MDIPTGGIFGLLRVLFKPIIDFIDKLLFYRAYEISTLHHNHMEVFVQQPMKLIESIEYKILWSPYYLRKKLATPMIWLRSTDNASFSKVVLTVTASNSKIRYQDHIILFELDNIPIQSALSSIPFRDVEFRNNMVYTPYEYIKMEIRELYDISGEQIQPPYSDNRRIYPCDNLEIAMGLQKGYLETWGEIFNLEFIESEIREERIRLIGPMFNGHKLFYYFRLKLFSLDWIVKTIFWSKNIIFAKQLRSEFFKYIENYEEHKKWQDENR